jgi:hypothetical protein
VTGASQFLIGLVTCIEVVADEPDTPATTRPRARGDRARANGRALGFRFGQPTRNERTRPRRHPVDDHAGSLHQSARALGDPSAALPIATALLGPEQPSKDAVYVDFASVILLGDQVLDQFAPWNWLAGPSRTETGPRSSKPPP